MGRMRAKMCAWHVHVLRLATWMLYAGCCDVCYEITFSCETTGHSAYGLPAGIGEFSHTHKSIEWQRVELTGRAEAEAAGRGLIMRCSQTYLPRRP